MYKLQITNITFIALTKTWQYFSQTLQSIKIILLFIANHQSLHDNLSLSRQFFQMCIVSIYCKSCICPHVLLFVWAESCRDECVLCVYAALVSVWDTTGAARWGIQAAQHTHNLFDVKQSRSSPCPRWERERERCLDGSNLKLQWSAPVKRITRAQIYLSYKLMMTHIRALFLI